MRVAVLSDVHANLTALTAVARDIAAEAPDVVVCGGDLVGSGPRPAQVVDFVRDQGWPSILGNTDEVLWNEAPLKAIAARAPALGAMWRMVFDDVERTRRALGAAQIDWLRSQPMQWSGAGVTVVHGTPGTCWNAPPATASDSDLEAEYSGLGAIVLHGHTHIPYIRKLSGLTVANTGSVGMPHDDDPRACYVLVTDGVPEIRRVPYDVEAEISALQDTGSAHASWMAVILRSGKFSLPES
jgi:putative phosphoesterase